MWKLNTIINNTEQIWKQNVTNNVARRVRTRESLPTPPKGMEWDQDEQTLQWTLIPSFRAKKKREAKKLAAKKEKETETEGGKTVTNKLVVDNIPRATSSVGAVSSEETKTNHEDDWDMLSEKISISGSIGGGTVVITTASGSVRSLTSLGEISIPLRRSRSSSTIDSLDGDRALGLLGVDYVEHIVLPSDTLQGVCLAYKISLTRLRQVNQFSGDNLTSAPRKLIIPLGTNSQKSIRSGFVKMQNQDSSEYKTYALLAEIPSLKLSEAQEYLEVADWDLADAIKSAREDVDWDRDIVASGLSDSIQITVNLQPPQDDDMNKEAGQPPSTKVTDPVKYDDLPAIATKNVRPQDVYNAAPQHQGFGVELQSFEKDT